MEYQKKLATYKATKIKWRRVMLDVHVYTTDATRRENSDNGPKEMDEVVWT